MPIQILTVILVLLTLFCVAVMLIKLRKQPSHSLSLVQYGQLIFSGIIAFIADTIGIGSFAVNVACAKFFGTFTDEELPAINNGAQVIPGALESLFFMHFVEVDLTTLLTLVVGTCIGGLCGGFVVSRLMSQQAIRLAMMCSFSLIIFLLIAHQSHLLPIGGDLTGLQSWPLVIGFFAMVICGALTSVGVGLFVMVQAVLFLLNISPVVAFPIMTTAGAMQQPLTTLVFLQQDKVPLKKTFIVSLAGCIGVMIALPLFTFITVTWLHYLLLCITIYNLCAITHAYFGYNPLRKLIQRSMPVALAE